MVISSCLFFIILFVKLVFDINRILRLNIYRKIKKTIMIDIKDENWDEMISNSGGKLVIVDFWAPWCVPCSSIALSLQQIEDQLQERVRIMKMNIDDNPKIAESLGIRAIPTLLFYKEGQLCDKQVGVISASHLMDKVTGLL